ncbi:unnamed protein product [Sphagnum jensenii]|uniref:Uncharacterized protein n=1 Tax=Sphagnum jensenii TaxID=128206 RepID=A0ABP1C075_9BRYO
MHTHQSGCRIFRESHHVTPRGGRPFPSGAPRDIPTIPICFWIEIVDGESSPDLPRRVGTLAFFSLPLASTSSSRPAPRRNPVDDGGFLGFLTSAHPQGD